MAEELYFPFNAVEDETGMPDRSYDATDFAKYFSNFVGNGVYPNPSTGLQVLSLNNNMVLTVKAGSAIINGYTYILKDDMTISINTADAAYTRKDIIVLRLDLTDRWIKCLYRPGTASANPLEPTLIRNADVYELKLATVTVGSGVQVITQANVLDTRLDGGVCGIVSAVVDSVDTTELFRQYETYLNARIAEWNTRKEQQTTDWKTQMDSQKADHDEQIAAHQSEHRATEDLFDAWFIDAKANIVTLQSFNFDNAAELPGCRYFSTENEDGSFLETITVKLTGKTVATKLSYETMREGKETFVDVVTVYDKDGVTILKTSTIYEWEDENENFIKEVE